MNEKGKPEVFGGASVQKAGKTWFMAHSGSGGGVFLRTSKDGLNWGAKREIVPLGSEGSGYDHHIVGTTLMVEQDDNRAFLVLYITGGGGSAKSRGGDEDAHDYPETVHLWRAPLNKATEAKAWSHYRYNPVMMRGSASQGAGGAIWRFKAVPLPGGYGALYEGFGVVPELSGEPKTVELVRDYQYGTGANKFGEQVFSQGFMAGWSGKSLMAAWDETYFDPGVFSLAGGDGKSLFLAFSEDSVLLVEKATQLELRRRNGFHTIHPMGRDDVALADEVLVGPKHLAIVSPLPASPSPEWLIYFDAEEALIQNRHSGDYLTHSGRTVIVSPYTGGVEQRWSLVRSDG